MTLLITIAAAVIGLLIAACCMLRENEGYD